jgi:serine/threonine-protein kinase PpkA
VVFFEMLTGSLPYLGSTLADILTAHRSAPVPRLPEHLSAYQPILDRLLAKNPMDRYASAAEFLDALDALRTELMTRKPNKPQRSA